MNRAQRRAEAKGAAAKRALPRADPSSSDPSSEVCEGVCRACTRQRQLFLPARICGRCIEKAMALAMEMTPDQAAATLAALEEMEATDL